ncbi:PLP-dependent aminotransferase family protein [Paenisporosarcina cavernae]|uniref:PLP-dependent aminotransferase family protein n=1 Tax=Paenisporosarcina cavernae TaxID=2320858 RepID=A0A385YP65_9BACL|nr:PLP-dependent aminotransferase family protein [Paenisporosarcina cavernae]AYC28366.1 PLP-dependent aminotransferase family protein [Paenisporosarcina cavernae]
MDLRFIHLHKASSTPLYEQLYTNIKQAILDKELPIGSRLPAKRKLSEYLSISQTTVELAYGQLVAEGYVTAISRRGYYVENVKELAYIENGTEEAARPTPERKSFRINFSSAAIDTMYFPYGTWRKYAKELWDETFQEYLLTGDSKGDSELRQEIAAYLYTSRGVRCHADQIVIGSGTEQLLPQLISLLHPQAIVALEDPGYAMTERIFENNGIQTIAIPVDEDGIDVEKLENSSASVCYVTPSHQFPTGAVLPVNRRTQLLNWALNGENRYIMEDDFDSEFRYEGLPIPSLQGMDRAGSVIYLSTFSKSLMPSLRIAYAVLPMKLVGQFEELFSSYSCTVPRMDQQLVAAFMRDGHFSKHLNKMRATYRKKLHVVLATLSHYSPIVQFSGEQSGMHIVITISTNVSEETLLDQALNNDIFIAAMHQFRKTSRLTDSPQFLLGFGGIPIEMIPHSIDELFRVWNIPKKQKTESP